MIGMIFRYYRAYHIRNSDVGGVGGIALTRSDGTDDGELYIVHGHNDDADG